MPAAFEFQHRTRLISGPESIGSLTTVLAELNLRRPLLVSDAGVIAAGHFARCHTALEDAGFAVASFCDVQPNPTTTMVETAVEVARNFQPDVIIGLGGGSAMDCAKGANFLYSCGGRMQDYWGVGKATGDLLPLIAIPTTAGTGSEAQSFALISDAQTHVKMACGDRRALPIVSILDPVLTLTQPASVTAMTGIDAIVHALESYVTKSRNTMSQLFAAGSWQLMSRAFARVLHEPDNLTARADMQQGAYLAGMAIESSMLGAAHALANPLTAHLDVPHGQAVALTLPHVIAANAQEPEIATAYQRLAAILEPSVQRGRGWQLIVEWFTEMVNLSSLSLDLADVDPARYDLDTLTADALKQWTLQHNPLLLSSQQIGSIYERIFAAA